jgi:hypothetical protein
LKGFALFHVFKGGDEMAYETKVILQSLANQIVFAKTPKQAYDMVRSAAEVEGMKLPDYEKAKARWIADEEVEN